MYKYITIALLMLSTAACSSGHDEEEAVPEVTYECRTVPLEIRIPASEVQKRSPGDPGEDPRLPLPDFLYVYAAVSTDKGVEAIRSNIFSGIESHWQQSAGKSIYIYQAEINIPVVNEAKTAEVYIATSRQALQFSPAVPQSVAELRAMKIKIDENPGVSLRDIYYDTAAIENYGQNQSTVTALCTHLGAKVDLMWNLTDKFRTACPGWKVRTVSVHDMPRTGFAFQPLQNGTEDGTADPYVFTTDTGSETYGRTDTYAFQRSDATIHWVMTFTDGTSYKQVTGTYTPTAMPDEVAYYRLLFTVNGLNGAQDITVTDETND